MSHPNRPHILVVDDEPLITSLLQGELELEGYAVSTANDGSSGLIAIRSTPAPDLLLLDWNLPDFSGLEICRRVRATGLSIPILMVTAHDAIKDKVEALDAGADDYLVKPFSIEELLARLRALHRRAVFRQPRMPRQPRISRAVATVATTTKLAAVPSEVAWRNSIPTTTVHTHTTTPVGVNAVGRCQPRDSNHPMAVPVRNGQAVSATPVTLTPPAWFRLPSATKNTTQAISATNAGSTGDLALRFSIITEGYGYFRTARRRRARARG